MVNSGEYGGRVLRGFKGDGMAFIAGAILTPEMVGAWPLANRMALHKEGKVDWFGPPADDEQDARTAGKPARSRGVQAPKVTKAVQPVTAASKAKVTAPAVPATATAGRRRR